MTGKKWEKCIQDSCKEQKIFCKKLSDGTANWNRGNNDVRFQKSNECDFIIFDASKLFLLEAKAHKGKSLPINCIRPSQIKGLQKYSSYPCVICGLIVLFSDVGKAYFITINAFFYFMQTSIRKSIPISYFQENGIEIDMIKKRTNYFVDIQKLLKSFNI